MTKASCSWAFAYYSLYCWAIFLISASLWFKVSAIFAAARRAQLLRMRKILGLDLHRVAGGGARMAETPGDDEEVIYTRMFQVI
jgi:hypothetical protein